MNGLVLEGGAMLGMFSAGAIDVMMENEITFDAAMGVSAGAVFGCNIKSRQIGRALRYNKNFCKDKRYCSLRSLLKTGDLFNAKFCYDTLPNKLDLMDYKTFCTNPMKFFVVASDVENGTPVYYELKTCDKKDLEWMRASASMPLLSRIVEIDGKKLLDGGITDAIPLKKMQTLGYEKNIVILTRCRGFVRKKNPMQPFIKMKYRNFPNFVRASSQRHHMYNAETAYVAEQEMQKKVFVLAPNESLGISHIEKNPKRLEHAYDIGRKVAKEKICEIKKFLQQK